MNQQAGLAAIKHSAMAEDENWENGIKPFIAYQLEVVDSGYWESEMGTPNPSYSDVVELLTPKESGVDYEDFGLPDIDTPPAIRVSFTQSGDPVIVTVNI